MDGFRRYAIYYLPDGAFADRGAAWLGWDVRDGKEPAPLTVEGLPRPTADLTATPRKYGFHGTIKPPFRLREGTTAQALGAAVGALCASLKPVVLDEGLTVARLGKFIAIVPKTTSSALEALAADTVERLDAYRAEPGPAELKRRRQKGLSARQERMLQRWGYPYVMEEFRFHLTLTGPLAPTEQEQVFGALQTVFDSVLAPPYTIGSLCLVGEGADGRFRLIARHPLAG